MSGSFDDMDVPPDAGFLRDRDRRTLPRLITSRVQGALVIRFTCFDARRTIRTVLPDYADAQVHVGTRLPSLIASGKAVSAWALSTRAASLRAFARWRSATSVGFKTVTMSFPSGRAVPQELRRHSDRSRIRRTAGLLAGRLYHRRLVVSTVGGESVDARRRSTSAFEGTLESVFPTKAGAASDEHLTKVSYTERNVSAPAVKSAKPLAVIPVFPGTNCEYDTAHAVENAGGAG